ncbi:unnamed protein product, partial [Rotaria socialis]
LNNELEDDDDDHHRAIRVSDVNEN